jgi:hypothetical protein
MVKNKVAAASKVKIPKELKAFLDKSTSAQLTVWRKNARALGIGTGGFELHVWDMSGGG